MSWRVPLNLCTLRAMECCFCCLPAARALGLLSSASQRTTTKKVDRTRAPPPRLSPCSQTLSERAVRVHVGDKEDPDRERRRQSALARPRGNMVVLQAWRPVGEAVAQPLEWERGLTGPVR